MSFESRRTSSSNLYANLELLKFSDIVDCQNILLLHNLFYDRMPVSVQDTFAIDFTHAQGTRAEKFGLLNIPVVNTVSFGKNSIRSKAINSWNKIQSSMPSKLVSLDYSHLKNYLKKNFIASY